MLHVSAQHPNQCVAGYHEQHDMLHFYATVRSTDLPSRQCGVTRELQACLDREKPAPACPLEGPLWPQRGGQNSETLVGDLGQEDGWEAAVGFWGGANLSWSSGGENGHGGVRRMQKASLEVLPGCVAGQA